MSIVYRSVKGSKLTSAEVDGNFQYLENLVGGQGNSIVTENGFTLVGQDLTIAANWVWKILNISYTNTAAVVINIPFASLGNQRIDLIVANQSNTFERIAGVESASNPSGPAVPLNKIFVTFVTVTDSAIDNVVLPIPGTQFKKKSENAAYNDPTLTGADAVISLQPNGQGVYAFSNAGLTSIDGFGLDLITGNPDAEVPYAGKDILIYNNKAANLTLKHDGSGTADVKFLLEGGVDLVIPAGGKVWLKFGSSYCEMIFKSWSEGSDILEYANLAAFPLTGETEKIYVALDTNSTYRWSGSAYVLIGGGGKRTMYLYFPIFQNVAASTSWYALPSTGQIFTGTGYAANASLTDANDFADLSYLTPRLFVPFQHKVKSVSVHGGTNVTTVSAVQFAVVTSYVSSSNSGSTTIPNPLIVAQEGVFIYVAGNVNGFQKKFNNANLDTSTLNAGSDYRIVFKNANEASNIQRAMLIVEVEEVL